LEVVVVVIIIIVKHLVFLSSLEVDLRTTGAATALDDVGSINLGEIVVFGIYSECLLDSDIQESSLFCYCAGRGFIDDELVCTFLVHG
jgi:hypothetical protein